MIKITIQWTAGYKVTGQISGGTLFRIFELKVIWVGLIRDNWNVSTSEHIGDIYF